MSFVKDFSYLMQWLCALIVSVALLMSVLFSIIKSPHSHPCFCGKKKKSFMVEARKLTIAWGDTPMYWKWISLPKSRFSQVAKLKSVWWLHVNGKFDTKILSPKTTYEAFLVFNLSKNSQSFKDRPVQLFVHFEGRENEGAIVTYLDPSENLGPIIPRERGDGWKEIKMGEFFNEKGNKGSISCHMKEVSGKQAWSGVIMEGIEIRPRVK